MTDESQEKKNGLKRLVIEALIQRFKGPESLEHKELRAFSKGVEEGRELELIVLTGGLCNYSYKLCFEGNNLKNDDESLFVKLTFGNPIIFPEVHCSPKRTECEYKMMEMFAKVTPYPKSAVKPYMFFDLQGAEDNMKVIVTQFSSRLEEQSANMFVDGGKIDKAYATKIATSIAALHNAEVIEPDFNEDIKFFFTDMQVAVKQIFGGYFDEETIEPDRAAQRAKEMGVESLDEIYDVTCKSLLRTDCYVHGDLQPFNILVAGNAMFNEDEFSVGDVAFVDWEFSHCGPIGKDIGFAQCFPMACALAHACHGDESSSKSILEFFDTLWETYSGSINLDGKDLSLVDVYRQVAVYTGMMMNLYSVLAFHMEYVPVEEGNTDELAKIKESLGVLSLDYFEVGCLGAQEGATVEELRKRFKDAIQKELDHLAPAETAKSSRRRSSLLRTTGRRVSDAHSYFAMIDESQAVNEFNTSFIDVFKTFAPPKRNYNNNARASLAITDLKRRSMHSWNQTITDFSF